MKEKLSFSEWRKENDMSIYDWGCEDYYKEYLEEYKKPLRQSF